MKKKIQIIKQVNLNYNKDILGINSKLIDCMRVLAAWCVLLGHCFSSFSVTIFKDEEKFFYIQNIAVIIFFTLAGFLMVYSLNKKKEMITWKDYIWHQAKRIYRIYVPTLLLVMLIDEINIMYYPDLYKFYDSFTFKAFIGNILMLQNIQFMQVVPRFGSDMPLWTMAIEWWLYVICSFFYIKFYIQKKRDLKNILIAFILVIIFVKYIYSGLAICFVFGMAIYLLYEKGIRCSIKIYLYTLAIVVAGILFIGVYFKQAYIMPVFILMPLLFFILLGIGREILNKKNTDIFLRVYARSTFALYLLHYPIIELVNNFKMTVGYKLLLVVLLSNIISIVVTILFDHNAKSSLVDGVMSVLHSQRTKNSV